MVDGIKMWVDVLAPIATVVLSLIVYHSNKVSEARETRRRQREEQLRQPSKVAAWFSQDRCLNPVSLENASNMPVYEVVITFVRTSGASCAKGEEFMGDNLLRRKHALLPPGRYSLEAPLGDLLGGGAYPGVEIAFTCADGTNWIRRANGKLEQIEERPFAYYQITIPCDYDALVGGFASSCG